MKLAHCLLLGFGALANAASVHHSRKHHHEHHAHKINGKNEQQTYDDWELQPLDFTV